MKHYKPRPHAVDRALLRFGIYSEQAESWFNQLMVNARLIGTHGKQEVYDHKGKRIIVQDDEIITIIKAVDLPFGNKISDLVRKELAKSGRELAKLEKESALKIAEIDLERATVQLNLLKAKSPVVKKKLIEKLDTYNDELQSYRREIERKKDDYNAMKMQSTGYLIAETCGGAAECQK
ncbi:hypothetical protein [Bacillus sp. JJ722]|uniref:hypothetical protein n=1 Tax=Bacillus sp. JJ722 TaxID=3122973 RepID=UPI002FFE1B38